MEPGTASATRAIPSAAAVARTGLATLASDLEDLQERVGNIVVGYTRKQEPVTVSQLNAQGAITALLRDAFQPNLVQTLENNPAFMHGGPFANIAHGCNSETEESRGSGTIGV